MRDMCVINDCCNKTLAYLKSLVDRSKSTKNEAQELQLERENNEYCFL